MAFGLTPRIFVELGRGRVGVFHARRSAALRSNQGDRAKRTIVAIAVVITAAPGDAFPRAMFGQGTTPYIPKGKEVDAMIRARQFSRIGICKVDTGMAEFRK